MPLTAAEFFAAKLCHETDPSDVAAARAAGVPVVVVDVRDAVAWDQGHIPGALHLPAGQIPSRLADLPPVDDDPDLVVYCWGPGCNGSTKAALALTRAGYRNVREMIGGFEYWAREGLAIESAAGRSRRPVDELTAPRPALGEVDRGDPAVSLPR
jgi:rhodanese-related sulfurtransferase